MASSRTDQSGLSLRSSQREILKTALDSLTAAADSMEEHDESLSEVLLCLGDVLDDFLRTRRGVFLSNEPWRNLDVSSRTSLDVLDSLLNGKGVSDQKAAQIDVCGLSLADGRSPFVDKRQGIA